MSFFFFLNQHEVWFFDLYEVCIRLVSVWLFFWGCTEIPSSYGNVTMGLGEATRLWSGWFEHSPFQKAETSNLPKLVNLTNETHSDSFHFTRTAIENKKSWTNTTCIQKRKIIREKNTLKHCCCRVLLGFQGDIRNIQKHSNAHGYCGYSSPCYCLKGITFSNHWGWPPTYSPWFRFLTSWWLSV